MVGLTTVRRISYRNFESGQDRGFKFEEDEFDVIVRVGETEF